ncbi:MAG: class I tRNA ligase family protein, partial [Proteobacteria bacterium]|nr:class I tRNA ligase family protein [Pseudomonadota bacterium]
QRYWGTPIPVIHCPKCGVVPVPEQDLPVVLPEDLIPDGSGNPLNKCEAFLNVACPTCGQPARRETDTMDTFVDSAWYFMRYCCPDSHEAMIDARQDYWMPMEQYIGGIEHAVLHLLYARFWTKAMRDIGLVKYGEPFTKLFTQGMLLNESFYREEADGKRRWYYPAEVDISYDDKGAPTGATARDDGQPVMLGGIEKMSKSKNNVVEPRDIIAKFGADTARVFTMFAGPPDQSAAWSDSGAEGAFRFLRRLWSFCARNADAVRGAAGARVGDSEAARTLRREVHLLLRQITHDYDRLQYNTVVSGAMKLLNALEAACLGDAPGDRAALREGIDVLIRALYPVAPHATHALWHELGFAGAHGSLLDAPWPKVDDAALVQSEIELMLQVNGKLRGSIKVPAQADKAAIEAAALASPDFVRFAEGKKPKKVVIVPGRLVNVVV